MIARIIRSKLIRSIIMLLLTVALGFFGYLLLFNYAVIDALYMTVITITTVGFGEVHPFGPGEKLFSILLILISITTVGYAISLFSEYLFTGNFFENLKHKRMENKIEKIQDHIIVCGYGRNGKQTVEILLGYNRTIVVVENEPKILESLSENDDVYVIKGDATCDEILEKAGIKRASCLIAALSSDADNLFVVLTSKQLNNSCRVISRAYEESAYKKIKFAGADNVIMPDKLGGSHMASLVVTPDLIEFVANLTLDGYKNANLREIAIDDLSHEYIGKTILDLDIRKKSGCNIIGFKDTNGEYIINPDVTTRLEKGTFLIILGRYEQIKQLKNLF